MVEKSRNYDKYFPIFLEQDYFVRITCNTGLDMSIADALAVSFVFELQATHNLLFQFSEGRPNPEYTYYEDDELTKQSYNIFPLLHGDGIKELLELYNRAKDAIDTDYKILGFTKVIEYIAPTISKEKLYAEVKMQLSLPSVFSPTAKFISDFGEIYRRHQNDSGKDLELIGLAVMTTVDLNDIWDLVPNFIKSPKIVSMGSFDEDAKVNLLKMQFMIPEMKLLMPKPTM